MHKLIFEGAELTGKSYSIYPVWNHLEQRYNSGAKVMDGCTWFNVDIGLFGTDDGWPLITKYLEIAEMLPHRNIIFEKFHLTHYLYSKEKDTRTFHMIDEKLAGLGFIIVVTTVQQDPVLYTQRLSDRLAGNPAYSRIAQTPEWYLTKDTEYLELVKESTLDHLVIDNTIIPNDNYKTILSWLNEG